MDQTFLGDFCLSANGLILGDETPSSSLDSFEHDYTGTSLDQNSTSLLPSQPSLTIRYCAADNSPPSAASVLAKSTADSSVNPVVDSIEDFGCDVVLKYISQMLMEEDIEGKACMFQSAALKAAERSFYFELLGDNCPAPTNRPGTSADLFHDGPDENRSIYSDYGSSSPSSCSGSLANPGWRCDPGDGGASLPNSQSSNSLSSCAGRIEDGHVDSPVSTLRVPDAFATRSDFWLVSAEGKKSIPNGNGLIVDLESNSLLKDMENVVVTVGKNHEADSTPRELRGKKNPHPKDADLDGRSNKQSSLYTESAERSELFDMVLLGDGHSDSAPYQALLDGSGKSVQKNGHLKGFNGNKARRKRQGGKKGVVDLRTLLTLCAQAVAANDRRNANELLKQIREHASPTGDDTQRMAHYFADGLEARLAGTGTKIYTAIITKPTSAAAVLKAYHLLLTACPFRKLSIYFANKTIMNAAARAKSLHIIDVGILYGFQWPSLIERLSSRPGGPPKLRITGIDFPHPGFRPAERVAETGRRLLNYAKTFGVPFEFNAIAKQWETIQIDDLKLGNDEVLVVNCLYRLRNLLDETVVEKSPRNVFLNLIRKANPDIFIQGIVNGAYSAPFFISRFREALFHFSTLFDVLETTVLREVPERMLIEKELLGWEAMNVIACEGSERIERPETYKQWQVRNIRAGFKQLPLNREIVNFVRERVKNCYHSDFIIDEDGGWLLQGWKGRIVFAVCSWKPAN